MSSEMINPNPENNNSYDLVPDFMREDKPSAGLELLKQYIVPPRIKVVQKQSLGDISERFYPGDVILMPSMVELAPVILTDKGKPTDKGNPFHFVPLFFYVEWCCWNPLSTKGTLPTIRERSLDENSLTAQRARDPKQRKMICPEMARDNEGRENYCNYVEHLNFIVLCPFIETIATLPCILTFSRAEHRAGTNFAALARMRNAPLFGCVYEAQTHFRENAKGEWYGIDIANPSKDSGVPPFVTSKEQYETYKQLHLDLAEKHKQELIRAEYEYEDEDETTGKPSNEF